MQAVALRSQPQPSDEIVYDDPVFFHRSQISVGTELKCYGRKDPNSIWRVAKIATFVKQPSGKYGLRPTPKVVHLDDQIFLERQGGGRRQTCFSTLSYSAIWRLA